GRRLVNQYGASEASAVSALWEVESPLPEGRVPIGRPTRGTRTYVLDRGGQLVPVGVEGELHVGGVGLARGYWAQPGLTAERFVPDRVSGVPGARLYRMGDRARYRADGAIEYLGRQDQQVKVRGYRIELGEIDAALRRHAGVREAATVVRAGAAGGARLVAHVAWDGPRGSVAELRAGLQRALPAYMLPAAIVEVDALPLTPSGKVDRRALPEPATVIGQSGEFVPPDTAVERRIAGIWEELLEVRPVGRTDNFFELGGHSIVAVRLISRLREVFGISLGLRTVFDGPTVGELAAHVPGGQAPSGGESRA
ncbi:MAG: phosphopantetheine-binding protein, partial [Candidatus Rokuibacteriota bacterium]